MLLWQKEHFIYVKLYQQLLTVAEVYLNRSNEFTKAIIDMAKNIVYKLHKYTYLCVSTKLNFFLQKSISYMTIFYRGILLIYVAGRVSTIRTLNMQPWPTGRTIIYCNINHTDHILMHRYVLTPVHVLVLATIIIPYKHF